MRDTDSVPLPPLPEYIRYKVWKRTLATSRRDYFWKPPKLAAVKSRYGHLPTLTALAKDISHKDEALAENHPTLGWCEDWEGLHRAMGRLFIGVLRDVQPPGHRWILYRGCQEPVNLSLYPRAARVDWSAISFDYEPAIFESRLWQPDVNEWMDSCLHGLLWPEKKVVKGRSFDPYPDKSLAQVIRNCPVWFDMGFDFDAVTFYATSPEWMERVERAVNDVTREFALEGD